MTEFMLYVDEAGHAEINYLDRAQPYHVAVSFLLSSSRLEHVRDLFRKVEGPRSHPRDPADLDISRRHSRAMPGVNGGH
jgi:hypothetical protein